MPVYAAPHHLPPLTLMNGTAPLPTTRDKHPSRFSMALPCASISRKRMSSGDCWLLQPQRCRFCPGFEGGLLGHLFLFDRPVTFFRELALENSKLMMLKSSTEMRFPCYCMESLSALLGAQTQTHTPHENRARRGHPRAPKGNPGCPSRGARAEG
jgi:hypothetical protein